MQIAIRRRAVAFAAIIIVAVSALAGGTRAAEAVHRLDVESPAPAIERDPRPVEMHDAASADVFRRFAPGREGKSGLLDALLARSHMAAPAVTAQPARGLRLLSYNIRHGAGLDGRTDLTRIADLIVDLNADVVALQEVDRRTARTGGIDQAAELARLAGYEFFFFAGFMDYRGGEYGMAVLSRLPIIEAKRVQLPWDAEPRASAVVTVRTDAGPVTIANVHFYKTARQRLAQAEVLQEALRDTAHPTVWVGDFNSMRGDAVMSWLDGPYAVPPKQGNPDTFPADRPSREIDFVAFTPHDAFEVVEHRTMSEPVFSDHLPVLAELKAPPAIGRPDSQSR